MKLLEVPEALANWRASRIASRAWERCGELLSQMEKAKGSPGNQHTGPVAPTDRSTPTLRDLGISKQQSSDWQKLAAVPKEQFDAALADQTQKPSTVGIINAAKRPAPGSGAASC